MLQEYPIHDDYSHVEESLLTGASYACVSREWQQFFEQYTFNDLVLCDTDVTAFCRAVEGDKVVHLSYIQRIGLFIRLDKYGCSVCLRDEDDDEIKK